MATSCAPRSRTPWPRHPDRGTLTEAGRSRGAGAAPSRPMPQRAAHALVTGLNRQLTAACSSDAAGDSAGRRSAVSVTHDWNGAPERATSWPRGAWSALRRSFSHHGMSRASAMDYRRQGPWRRLPRSRRRGRAAPTSSRTSVMRCRSHQAASSSASRPGSAGSARAAVASAHCGGADSQVVQDVIEACHATDPDDGHRDDLRHLVDGAQPDRFEGPSGQAAVGRAEQSTFALAVHGQRRQRADGADGVRARRHHGPRDLPQVRRHGCQLDDERQLRGGPRCHRGQLAGFHVQSDGHAAAPAIRAGQVQLQPSHIRGEVQPPDQPADVLQRCRRRG